LFPVQAHRRCRDFRAAGLALLWALGTAPGRAAAAKMPWGKLTDDRWLQIEGRRLKYAALLKENTAFAQTRTSFRPSM